MSRERVYEEVIDGHGVRVARTAMGGPVSWEVFAHDGGPITTFSRETIAWTLCDRLRDAHLRGRRAEHSQNGFGAFGSGRRS